VKKFDLRKDMQFNTQVKSAKWQEMSKSWKLIDQSGTSYTSRYIITAMGILNEPTYPVIPGVEDFKGASWHTARWPADSSSLDGKRVAIIGTGATAIDSIQEIVKTVGSLHVFQRTPNWTAPIRNSKISKEEMAEIRARYPDIFQKCLESYSCFIHVSDPTKVAALGTPEEREAHWEKLYSQPGFAKVLGVSADIATDREANRLYSDFNARKIRARVRDPVVAEKLIPKCHGFGTRRVPLENGYYEAFNEPHVKLVDIKESPIERITDRGIKTQDQEYEFDIIVYATGFDATTGSFRAVDFEGVNNIGIMDAWDPVSKGIRTYLGLTVKGFPNMFMIMGPHQMFGNIPRSIEYAVDWVSQFIEYARDHDIKFCEATEEKVDEWTEHVHACSKGLLMNEVDSWMTGVNKNLQHKQKRSIVRYNGPAPGYRKQCNEVRARGYSDFVLA